MNVELFEEILSQSKYPILQDTLIDSEWSPSMSESAVDAEISSVYGDTVLYRTINEVDDLDFLKNEAKKWSVSDAIKIWEASDFSNEELSISNLTSALIGDAFMDEWSDFTNECRRKGVYAEDDDIEL